MKPVQPIDGDDDWLDAPRAAALLGIKLQTLYAYASRGLLKSRRQPEGRARLYRREDLDRVRLRAVGPAAQALRFGEPVLETRISRVSARGPEYRGRPALALAASAMPFEAVAELLWSGAEPAEPPAWPAPRRFPPVAALQRLLPKPCPPLTALGLLLPVLAAGDPLRVDPDPQAMVTRARALIPLLAAGTALALDTALPARLRAARAHGDPVLVLAAALGLPADARTRHLLRLVLVIGADHELNASTFAARVAASTGADLYGCLSAALATFSGPRHGLASDGVEALLRDAGGPRGVPAALAARLRHGERIPGFGHPLYPRGDPRAPPLLQAASELQPRSERLDTLWALVRAMAAAGKPAPNVDVGLVAVGAALALPLGVMPALFAIGRCAGWVAHALEQQQSTLVLRPRARYVG
jgi:citrate synthase